MKDPELALKPRCRAWLEKDRRPVFGDGRARLLEGIRRVGSIKGGAQTLGMSYRNAWVHLNHMEQRLGMKLVERRVGGSHGGGSRLTPAAAHLLSTYRLFRKALDREMRALWRKTARQAPR
jgi:molybdate transport system regulatory protein